MAKRNKSRLLRRRLLALPALRAELLCVLAPDFRRVVHRVRGHAEDGAGGEVVASDGHAGRARRDLARQADARGAVVAESLVDDIVEVGQIADHVVVGNVCAVGDGGVELLLKLLVHARVAAEVVEQRAGRVGRGVAAGNELCQGLGGQFLAAERLALFVSAFLEAREEVLAFNIGRVLNAALDARDSDTSKVLNGVEALAEEGIRQPAGIWLQLREAAERGTHLTAAVKDVNGRGVDGRAIGRLANLGKVDTSVEHAKGGTKGEVADNVKGEVVEPGQAVEVGFLLAVLAALGALLDEGVELVDKEAQVGVHVGLKLADGLGGKGVRHELALAGVLCAVAGVEEAAADGDKGIVEFTAALVSSL